MRFLVVGLGSMGKRRIANLLVNGERDITGYDTDPTRFPVIEALGVAATSHLSRHDDYDVMIVSTPPASHAPYIRKALREGKHFLVEHGVSDNAYDEIAAEADDGIVRVPSCTFRFHPAVRAMKTLLDEGRIGKLLAYQHYMGQYLPDWHPWEDYRRSYFAQRDTSAAREMFPFEQTWVSWLVGSMPDLVQGWIGKVSDLDMDADDYVVSSLRYPNGVVGSSLIDVVARHGSRSIRLIGSTGNIEWESGEAEVRVYDGSGQPERIQLSIGSPAPGYVNTEQMYVDEIATFLSAIRGDTPWPYSFDEDREYLRWLDVLIASEMYG